MLSLLLLQPLLHWTQLRSNNFKTFDGTSMACPHVAGAAALYMADDPSMTPEQLLAKLQTHSSKDQVTNGGDGSPNLLLFVGDEEDAPTTTTAPSPPPSINEC